MDAYNAKTDMVREWYWLAVYCIVCWLLPKYGLKGREEYIQANESCQFLQTNLKELILNERFKDTKIMLNFILYKLWALESKSFCVSFYNFSVLSACLDLMVS